MSNWQISDPVFESDYLNDKLRVAPWEGHRKFAYDLLKFIKPKTIVELGSHYGCSLFSFAQSIKDNNLDTRLHAVDTWGGDEQAGFYGEEVINKVTETISKLFNEVNIRLLRKTFDEALIEFNDESIDIIHIDGLHTYEAVLYDYKTWRPKLSKDGIMLFHDVYSPLQYGSNQFWQEIKSEFPHYEFLHSWGLGVLFPNGNDTYKMLESINFLDKALIYEYKSLFEFEKLKNADLSKMVSERDKSLSSNEKMIEERDLTINNNEKTINDLNKTISDIEKLVVERDIALVATEKLVIERDLALRVAENLVIERDQALSKAESLINEISKNYQLAEDEKGKLMQDIEQLQELAEQQQTMLDYYNSKKIIINFKKKR